MNTSNAQRKLVAILATSACLGAFTLAGAAAATPALADGPIDGCPAGDVCLYDSQAELDDGLPLFGEGSFEAGLETQAIEITLDVAVVNNTDSPEWTSEGSFVLEIPGVLCVYQADSSDVQAPDTVEDPADGATVDGLASGPTQASVSGTIIAALSDCS